jgi:hypothetical protein
LQVCNGANGEIRGIRVGGDTTRVDGTYWNQVDESSIGQPRRLICGKDGAPQYGTLYICGEGRAATGLVVHTNKFSQPVGLQLICRRIASGA